MFDQLVLQPGLTFAAAFFGLAFSFLLWFLVRQRRQRIWFPILRVVPLESRVLPKLMMRPPPWLAFLCFLACALGLLFLTLKPSQKVYTPFQPNRLHVHVFFDMSASMSHHVSLEEYSARAMELLSKVQQMGRVSYSLSHKPQVYDLSESQDALELIRASGFHRPGLKIGQRLEQQLEKVGDFNLLVVVSDGDQFSFGGFNWDFLQDIEIRFLSLATKAGGTNLFIDRVSSVQSERPGLKEWDVTIQRTGASQAVSGTLKARLGTKELFVGAYSVPMDQNQVDLRVRVDEEKFYLSSQDDQAHIVWEIEADVNEMLTLDNVFRSPATGMKRKLLLIADPMGESFLEDPAHHLEVTLKVLGFQVDRLDDAGALSRVNPRDYPAIIVLAGSDRGVESFCPAFHSKPTSASDMSHKDQKTSPIVWLAPFSTEANWSVMCQCVTRYTGLSQNDPSKDFCKDVETRNQYIGILKSLGGKQVGGELDDYLGSIAFHMKDNELDWELLTFTLPLKPDPKTGVSYAVLPLITKTLAGWQNLYATSNESSNSEWPRINDIAKLLSQESEDHNRLLLGSNVPRGESIIHLLPAALLPKPWDPELATRPKAIAQKKDQDDPMPFLKMIFALVVFFCGLEALVYSAQAFRSFSQKKAVLFLLAIFLPVGNQAEAQVTINLLGSRQLTGFARLSREVTSRTSISLNQKVKRFSSLTDDALSEPWLWVQGVGPIANKEGFLLYELTSWLKRGGLLIIENAPSKEILSQLTSGNIFSSAGGNAWQAIPPDHELMRSFHLLESLPVCSSNLWQGFHFDGRLAILAIPENFLSAIEDRSRKASCSSMQSYEQLTRVFVNVLMVALATDYKKDQIHLPEILKRLR